MALIKDMALSSGPTGQYHRILELIINWGEKTAYARVATYVNQQARLDGKTPLICRRVSWDQAAFPFVAMESDPRVVAYGKLKETPTFTGAQDA